LTSLRGQQFALQEEEEQAGGQPSVLVEVLDTNFGVLPNLDRERAFQL